MSVLIHSDDGGLGPEIVRRDDFVAVGVARLDNREEIAKRAGLNGEDINDVELMLALISRCGERSISEALGDYGFVVRHRQSRRVVAVCDVFAVRKLYYVRSRNLLAVASRAELLAPREEYDVQYLAELVSYCSPSAGRCAYAGVTAVPPATALVFDGGTTTTCLYWSARDQSAESGLVPRSNGEAAEKCRDLLAQAVQSRLRGRRDIWAQLSGGMDSSSVVCMAEHLAATGAIPVGLAGTITYVDHHGTGADERKYSNAVAQHLRIRNEQIVGTAPWQDDELGPPRLDQPSGLFPWYARDRQLCAHVRRAGGHVLLTGHGGDDLFAGNMFFFADWLAKGRVYAAMSEMLRRAAIGRVSFWDLAYKNAILPLLPAAAQRRLIRGDGQVPGYVTSAIASRYGLRARAVAPMLYMGRVGHKYEDALVDVIASIPAKLSPGVIEDALDVRHPYLYRPLVEFALRLPAELNVRPHARKGVLREATRGILPEAVRGRIGKGVLLGVWAWSAIHQRTSLVSLLRDPILAQLGVIDPQRLRAAFETAQYERDGTSRQSSNLQYTLAIEAWLQMRSGRWPVRPLQSVLKQHTLRVPIRSRGRQERI